MYFVFLCYWALACGSPALICVYVWRAGAVKLLSLHWKLSQTLLGLIIENHLIFRLYV